MPLAGGGRVEAGELQDRFRGSLLGVGLGDALGAPYEGSSPREPAAFSGWERQAPNALRYTDDTHMTIGVARSLIACGGAFDGAHMAATFAADYEAEPWRGYGAGPPRVFALLRRGVTWDQAAAGQFGGEGSFGNGAAMRAAPIGLLHLHDLDRAGEVARASARITHTHPLGEEGASLMACAVAWLAGAGEPFERGELLAMLRAHARTDTFQSALDRVERLPPSAPQARVVDELGNGIEAHRSVPVAVHVFLRHPDSFSDAVAFAVALGGDTDTIASMTGALAGASLGAAAIPSPWREALEDTEVLVRLADGLYRLVTGSGGR